jgi:hypothetical protein
MTVSARSANAGSPVARRRDGARSSLADNYSPKRVICNYKLVSVDTEMIMTGIAVGV